MNLSGHHKVIIFTTGGTLDKVYDEEDGSLKNKESLAHQKVLQRLRLPNTEVEIYSLLSIDSLDMTDEDRQIIFLALKKHLSKNVPILVLHGTDTMTVSATYCFERIENLQVPVIFTGAMKPLGFDDSDAYQNVTEALMATRLLTPGFYISFHNAIFPVPKVRKNREKRTFEAT